MRKVRKKTRLLALLMVFCLLLSMVPMTTFAANERISEIKVNAQTNYAAGETPQATATITNSNSNCTIAYECWRELYKPDPNGVWETKAYWYSDAEKMANLSEDEKFTRFEAGKEYSYDVILKADSGYFFNDEKDVKVYFNDSNIPVTSINLEVKDMSTTLTAYSIYGIILPSSENVIDNVEIVNATLSYNAGDTPVATAGRGDENAPNYEIAYECWEEMEQTANGLEPVAFWYSDESKYTPSMKKIMQFEDGKKYMYSIELKTIDGYTFASADAGFTMKLNGRVVDNKGIQLGLNETTLFATALKTINPKQPVQPEIIDSIKINGVTSSFEVGDKPVFTGEAPDNATWIIDHEAWTTDDAGITSSDFWNQRYGDFDGSWGKVLTSFEADKQYTYNVYFKLSNKGYNENYRFGEQTKLYVNGELMNIDPESISLDSDGETIWFWNVMTITPKSSETPSNYEIIEGANSSWVQNSDGTLTFRANGDFGKFTGVKIDGVLIDKDNYEAASGSTIITLKADFLKTLSAGLHKLTVVYIDGECSTDFNINEESSGQVKNSNVVSEGSTTDTSVSTIGQETGENSSFVILIAILCISSGGIVVSLYCKHKKLQK